MALGWVMYDVLCVFDGRWELADDRLLKCEEFRCDQLQLLRHLFVGQVFDGHLDVVFSGGVQPMQFGVVVEVFEEGFGVGPADGFAGVNVLFNLLLQLIHHPADGVGVFDLEEVAVLNFAIVVGQGDLANLFVVFAGQFGDVVDRLPFRQKFDDSGLQTVEVMRIGVPQRRLITHIALRVEIAASERLG